MLHKELQCSKRCRRKKNGYLDFMLASDVDESSMGYMGKTNESALFADLNNQNTKRKINKRLRKFVYIISQRH
jgi:hypothetical protein